MSRLIDADVLMELLTTAIRNMKGIANFLGVKDDPEIQMEIKAYTDIANGVKDMPTIEPERKTGHWILDWKYNKATCSECHHSFYDAFDIENYDDFCRHCGAKMISAVDKWGKESEVL